MRYGLPIATGLVVVGVLLRFMATSQLWLDETLSVNIARLPLRQIPGALRHDGAPPLYYLLLHGWMRVFGESNFAVRALSGVVSCITLPFAWIAGKRLGGRRLAWAALLLLASSPFAINYATATRMYSLMMLWSLLGFLALARALEFPSRRRLAAVGALTALQLYTHYWGIYVVGVTGLWLLIRAKRVPAEPPAGLPSEMSDEALAPLTVAAGSSDGVSSFEPGAASPPSRSADFADHRQRTSWSCFLAMCAGSLAFLPWLPSFLFQTLHTGTPWSNAAGLGDILGVLGQYAGGGPWGAALGLSLFTLLLLGVFGESIDGRRVLINLSARRKARPIGFVFMGTLVVAVICGAVAQAAFVGRYTAVVFPLFVLLAALGVTAFADRRVLAAMLAWTTVCGLIVGIGANLSARTEAGRVASVINAEASPNDMVVYCPDQLGPAVARLVTARVQQASFPHGNTPGIIDWVNYSKAIHETDVEQFAKQMVSQAAGRDIWYVWSPSYPGTEHKCSRLMDWFGALRRNGQELVTTNATRYYEHEALVRFPE